MINYDLKKIKAIVFDVDGVLSAETIQMDDKGEPIRTINIKDGYAIQLAVKHGLHLAIMTGGHNDNIRLRYDYLGVKDVYINCSMKINVWSEFLHKYALKEEEIIYVGACCPKDACSEIKHISTYVSDVKGGDGVARDILEQVMKAQGKWVLNEKAFGW